MNMRQVAKSVVSSSSLLVRWRVAANVGLYRVFAGATGALFSPMYSSRLDNRDFDVTLVPGSLSASFEVTDWLVVHQTLTFMSIYAPGHLASSVTPGYSVVAEFSPLSRHALVLHAAEVGFWHHDLALLGASYRYRNQWLELRLGYFYRFGRSSASSTRTARSTSPSCPTTASTSAACRTTTSSTTRRSC